MCHGSMTSTMFTVTTCVLGFFFLGFHMWKFDKFRCLRPRKEDLFRCIIVWCLTLSVIFLLGWNVIEVYIKYTEGLTQIEGVIMVNPWQLWSEKHRKLWTVSYFLLASAWTLLMAVHLEEFIFWAYLMKLIRTGRSQPWFRSVYFKVWVVSSVASGGAIFGATAVETEILTQLETNVFLAGSILSTLASLASIVLVVAFPRFVEDSRKQGANAEVIGKLVFFKQLNFLRCVFRALYSTGILILSIDGLTEAKRINSSHFWLDLFWNTSIFCVMAATFLSCLILLPRNMQEEAGYTRVNNVFVRQGLTTTRQDQPSYMDMHDGPPSYKSPVAESETPWNVLGDRLRLEKDDVRDMADGQRTADEEEAYEMPFARFGPSRRASVDTQRNVEARVVNHFVSPLDVNAFARPQELRVVMQTTTHVEKE